MFSWSLWLQSPRGRVSIVEGMSRTTDVIRVITDELTRRQQEIDQDEDLRRIVLRVVIRDGRPRSVLFEKLTENDLTTRRPAH